ncbi:MAG: sodium:solute symporter family protein, partial [Planctomycetes bacterium]|nr:sodium:solute symporter family protein [Planctomycetota bacterium]
MLPTMSGGQTAVLVIAVYLSLLLILGAVSSRFLRGSAADYFLASRGIGSFLLVMSLFGTTMTAFALVGSTGEAFKAGIGVYGKMASWSGIVHSACFFFVGIKLWSFGKRYGYVTQIQFFRDRFESNGIGLVLFPLLVGLVIPYLLIGVLSAGTVINKITAGAFPTLFAETGGAIPFAVGSGAICLVVLVYVFLGGVRGTAWANAFQTMVFIVLGLVTFLVLADKLGGIAEATNLVREHNPTRLKRDVTTADIERYETRLAEWEQDPTAAVIKPAQPHRTPPLMFLSYAFIPLSVGMFPHLFQHWLTARSAKSFRLSVVGHPICILIVWVPCVLMGVWATAVFPANLPPNAVLAKLVADFAPPALGGLLTAGILAAIMSSMDSQFLCLGSMFSNDIAVRLLGKDRLSERQKVLLGRVFVIMVVAATYLIALRAPRSVFQLGVWCFTGFAGLFPIVFAAVYWRRSTKWGA